MFDKEYFSKINKIIDKRGFISSICADNDIFNIEELFNVIDSYCNRNHIYNVKDYGSCYNFNYSNFGYEISKIYGPEELFYLRKCNYNPKYLNINDILNDVVVSENDRKVSNVMNNLFSNIEELRRLNVSDKVIENETVSCIRKLKFKK